MAGRNRTDSNSDNVTMYIDVTNMSPHVETNNHHFETLAA